MVNVVPWDHPRYNIHHDTSSAFSNNVPVYTVNRMLSVSCVQCTVCTSYSCNYPSSPTKRAALATTVLSLKEQL